MESNWVNHWSESLHSKTYCLHRNFFSCLFHSNGKAEAKEINTKKKIWSITATTRTENILGQSSSFGVCVRVRALHALGRCTQSAWMCQTSFQSPSPEFEHSQYRSNTHRDREREKNKNSTIFTLSLSSFDVYLRIIWLLHILFMRICCKKCFNTVRLDKSHTQWLRLIGSLSS